MTGVDLAQSLRHALSEAEHPVIAEWLAAWPEPTEAASDVDEPVALPVTDWLDASAANVPAAFRPLVRDLARGHQDLRWQQTYSEADLGADFLERYGWTMLVGPDAPLRSTSLLSGFLMLGPGVHYPEHAHSAEEIYVVLSGAASWKIGSDDWQVKPAGTVVHNPPWQNHGMRTDQGEPLLLGFLWKAGAVEKSRFARQPST